jgi:hypothetical protein
MARRDFLFLVGQDNLAECVKQKSSVPQPTLEEFILALPVSPLSKLLAIEALKLFLSCARRQQSVVSWLGHGSGGAISQCFITLT